MNNSKGRSDADRWVGQ